jgi:hypothetical protein
MQHFIRGLYPRRIGVVTKTVDGITVNRLWDVERCPCLGCDYFHKVEIRAKVKKEMYANIKALG